MRDSHNINACRRKLQKPVKAGTNVRQVHNEQINEVDWETLIQRYYCLINQDKNAQVKGLSNQEKNAQVKG